MSCSVVLVLILTINDMGKIIAGYSNIPEVEIDDISLLDLTGVLVTIGFTIILIHHMKK